METPSLVTFFAPPERKSAEAVANEARRLASQPLIARLLDGYPEPALVLNEERQICMVNDKLAHLLGRPREELLGLRPGEAFACIHAHEQEAGCGTSVFCKECGAVGAILNCQKRREADVQECRITAKCLEGTTSFDLRVSTTPLEVEGVMYTVFAVRDITDEKRRLVLERIFFHDILNAAGGLQGILEIWPDLSGDEANRMTHLAQGLSIQLIDEIRAQRDLASAERGDLVPKLQAVDVRVLVERICAMYEHPAETHGKRLAPPAISGDTVVCTDETLLGRVLGNLIKNALEASNTGQAVTVAYVNRDVPTLTVHNEGVMPEAVQLQIFQRSFTTKSGRGHGIGTYSVKLLTERYLKGEVTFRSVPGEGTTFVVRLPSEPPLDA